MALLAEEIVEEWLNRQGYFTIRGVKLGVHEMDILAIKLNDDGTHDCRHIEVQASLNPISYITRVPKDVQKETGRSASSAKRREDDELIRGVQEWIEKKFLLSAKKQLRDSLCAEKWSYELVVHRVRHPEELDAFARQNIVVLGLDNIIKALRSQNYPIKRASGGDLADLILL